MQTYPTIGLQAPTILLPKPSVDLTKWSVIACDQFTSQEEYWHAVEDFVGNAPSTYFMILPEAYLGTEKESEHAAGVLPAMAAYQTNGLFQEMDGFILVERSFNSTCRHGLMAALDLERYDYASPSLSLIRATEGTIVDRLPPRIAIRENASLEIPHILVLIDDPTGSVIEPLLQTKEQNNLVYDFDLMCGGGHITGRLINPSYHGQIVTALERLKSAGVQAEKYGVSLETPPMLFAVGDGNHSLATARAIWEKNKSTLPPDHPARFALVEIVNLHDRGIEFEAIHRLLITTRVDLKTSCSAYFSGNLAFEICPDFSSLVDFVDHPKHNKQIFGLFSNGNYAAITLEKPSHTLTVGSVQLWLDALHAENGFEQIDYIHGADTLHQMGTSQKNAGVYLPAMPKDALFKSVINDGPLPRKTFSMGEAHQKRFYLECRKIK